MNAKRALGAAAALAVMLSFIGGCNDDGDKGGCSDLCNKGQSRCTSSEEIELCALADNGCRQWEVITDCAANGGFCDDSDGDAACIRVVSIAARLSESTGAAISCFNPARKIPWDAWSTSDSR